MGFGPRINVYCKEAPGLVFFTDPAAEDEGDLDSLPETEDFGHRSLAAELKDRYRQRRDRNRELVSQLCTLNSRTKLNATEVRLLAIKLTKKDVQKFSRFDTFGTMQPAGYVRRGTYNSDMRN